MKNNKELSVPLSENQSNQAIWLSDLSPNDKVWDDHRANVEVIEQMYRSLGYDRYPERLNDCSRLLEFALKQDSDSNSLFKLQGAKFCRLRWCPVCQWRRTLMWRSRFYKAIPLIRVEYPTYKFLFLTLTVENCEVSELRKTVDWMNKSWSKLIKRKRFPARGFVKAIEITKSKNSLAHPHFHCILIVPSKYFKTKDYVSHNEWKKLWQQSLKVDYEPQVNIKKVKLLKSRERKISKRLSKELTENDIVFYGLMECLKYSVKESDLMSDPEWLDAITQQLHKTRAISLGGIFKEYLSEDEPEDLINTELEQDIEILEADARFRFGWKEEVKRYQSV